MNKIKTSCSLVEKGCKLYGFQNIRENICENDKKNCYFHNKKIVFKKLTKENLTDINYIVKLTGLEQ